MKKIICIIAAVLLIACAASVPAFADSATISLSKSNVTVGSNVTVTLGYNAGFAMYGIDISLTYNSAVLQYVSGGTNSGSTVKIVETLSGETSKRFSVTFKAIAAGAGSLKLSAKASGSGDGTASAGATVNVTTPQPSSNANLGSIKLSEGTLSPAFKQGTTSYTAAVKYQTEKISISANAAVGDSTVSGAGTYDLKVGDNSFNLTVTAASGDKKTYTVVVKRMTEEETAAAIKAERDNNPNLIEVDGADRFLKSDLSALGSFEGYTVSTVQRKGADISVLSDNKGKYKLFWATDAEGENGAFYTADESDKFTRVNYINLNNRLYIIEPFDNVLNVNPDFTAGEYDLNGTKVKCYKYKDDELNDFYVFNCYVGGKNGYYKFDAAENTIQREPQFLAKKVEAAVEEKDSGILDKFNSLSVQAKIVLGLLSLAAVLVIVLVVLFIVRAANSKKHSGKKAANDIMDFDLAFGGDAEQDPTNPAEIEQEAAVDINENTDVSPETDEALNFDFEDVPDDKSDESEFLD